MRISEHSPVVRLYDATYDHANGLLARFFLGRSYHDDPPSRTSVCAIFWRIVLRLGVQMILNLIYLYAGCAFILGLRRGAILIAQAAQWNGGVAVAMFVGAVLVLVFAVAAVILLGAGGVIVAHTYVRRAIRRRHRRSGTEEDVSLLVALYRSFKERTCHLVEIERDDPPFDDFEDDE